MPTHPDMASNVTRRHFLAAGAALCLAPFPSLAQSSTQSILSPTWQFYQGPLDPHFEVWHSEDLVTWADVTVPHCFNAYDACDPDTPAYRGPGWYRQLVTLHNPHPNGRTVLHFEGAGQRAEVYIGEQLAGTHSGGYDEFVVDITALVTSAPVQLAVLCDNSRDTERMPSDLSDFTLYGGLYRHVHLLYLPAISVQSLYTQAVWEPGKPAQLAVCAELYSPATTAKALNLHVRITSPKGLVVVERTLTSPTWTGEKELLTQELRDPELWSPDSPNLYRCELTLNDNAPIVQAFGIRQARFEAHGPFYLNGTRLQIKGTHRHEDHAGYAAAVPDEILRQEMHLIKQMGANFVRLAHYQQSRLTLDLCDELGLMVWEEVPWCRSGIGTALMCERGRRQLTNMITQHRNHPAIILWGLGNEDDWPGEMNGQDHDAIRAYMTELRDLAHKLDPTRLTSYRRCDFARDIPDVYSPSIWSGWYSGNYQEYQAQLEKARELVPHMLHVEFGADSHAGRHAEELIDAPGSHSARDTEWSETYACELFDWYLKTQSELPWLTGAVQWAFKDFTTPLRVGNPVPRVNQKGVVTRDMQVKEAYFVFQSWWATQPMLRVYGHIWPVRWGRAGQDRMVRVYSNCAEVELFLNGESLGKRKRDPKDFPCAGLRWNARFRAGKNTLSARAGTLIDTVDFTYQTEPWSKPAALRLTAAADAGTVKLEATMHDAKGTLCCDATAFVRFSTTGAARLHDNLGTPTGSRVVQLYNGRAVISLTQSGAAAAAVESAGLPQAVLLLPDPTLAVAQVRKNSAVAQLFCILLLLLAPFAIAQTQTTIAQERPFAGDAPADPGPLATLSPALKRKDIDIALVKVMDWSLRTHEAHFNRLWTYAALYDGLLATSKATGHPEGHDAVLHAAEGWHWQLEDTRFPHADDEALGRVYLDLYTEHPDPVRIANTQVIMDRLAARPDEAKPVWWWCDALYMAPPVLGRLEVITRDPKYLNTLDREWGITKAGLYDLKQHLYYRDDRFLDITAQHEKNGSPIFWSRGNGWVIAGLVSLLEEMPASEPRRAAYAHQFVDMMTSIAAVQPADGLWRAGLLDADAYKMPEVSGSAFFAYGMAYGIRTGLLDSKQFRPVLERCWSAMIAHIYADGRLGNIQPIGYAPDVFTPSSSYVYGVGAFLQAGAEIDKLLALTHGRTR